jgi:hypothetical protein
MMRDAWDIRLIGPIKKSGRFFPNAPSVPEQGPSYRTAYTASAVQYEAKSAMSDNDTSDDDHNEDDDRIEPPSVSKKYKGPTRRALHNETLYARNSKVNVLSNFYSNCIFTSRLLFIYIS